MVKTQVCGTYDSGSTPDRLPKEFTTDKAQASELRMSSRRFNRLDYRKFDTRDWWDASG